MEEIDKIGSEFMIFCFHSTVHTEKEGNIWSGMKNYLAGSGN